jgi:hypothetical protein
MKNTPDKCFIKRFLHLVLSPPPGGLRINVPKTWVYLIDVFAVRQQQAAEAASEVSSYAMVLDRIREESFSPVASLKACLPGSHLPQPRCLARQLPGVTPVQRRKARVNEVCSA